MVLKNFDDISRAFVYVGRVSLSTILDIKSETIEIIFKKQAYYMLT